MDAVFGREEQLARALLTGSRQTWCAVNVSCALRSRKPCPVFSIAVTACLRAGLVSGKLLISRLIRGLKRLTRTDGRTVVLLAIRGVFTPGTM